MLKAINYLDLFSGIGGFALGLQQSRVKIKKHYFSEIDPFAIKLYQQKFPKSKGLGDVKTIESFRRLGRIDLVTFGFPCQDLSIAGKGAGFDGERSSLFYAAIRIINEIRPTHFIFENVKGLFSNDAGRTVEKVLQKITDLGIYDCEWQLVNTSWLLPQNRERIYFVGHLRESSRPKVFPVTGNDRKVIGISGQHVNTITTRTGTAKSVGAFIVESELFQKTKKNPQGYRVKPTSGDSVCLSSSSGGFAGKTGLYAVPVLTPDRINKRQNGRRFKNANEPAFTITTQDRHGVLLVPEATRAGKVEIPANCGVDFTHPKSKTRRGRKMDKNCNTLTTGATQYAWYDGVRIRKLSPIECERLQGFPDGWTIGFSDSQRYKMLGNAVSVPMTKLIFQRLYNENTNTETKSD